MPTKTKTQFDYEDERLQSRIHEHRKSRAELVARLERSNWADVKACHDLYELNLRIEMLTLSRDTRWWYRREPSLEQIEARSKSWYWETHED